TDTVKYIGFERDEADKDKTKENNFAPVIIPGDGNSPGGNLPSLPLMAMILVLISLLLGFSIEIYSKTKSNFVNQN
ncbi:MAG: hypothetical protein ACHQFW_10730, partial [Chitinophagales bacterium]